jgi:branched-chain amino acid transport system substrate-binding protein
MKWFHTCLLAAAVTWTANTARAQILIGQTVGLTGPVAATVKEAVDGARLYLDSVNAKGGIRGEKIELVTLDDKFDPKIAAANASTLITEKNVVALFLNRGTPHTEAIMPLLDKHGVALVAPSTGAMLLHSPVNRYVFNVRSSYQREAAKAVAHLHTLGINRIAVVHVDDTFGADALEGANKGFAKAEPQAGGGGQGRPQQARLPGNCPRAGQGDAAGHPLVRFGNGGGRRHQGAACGRIRGAGGHALEQRVRRLHQGLG